MDKKKRNDLILILLVLAIGIVGFFGIEFYKSKTTLHGEAVIYVDGTEVGRYPLHKDNRIEIKGKNGTNYLVIQDGKAWIEEADCPDRICILRGKIDKNGETVVCLPNKIVVEIQNGEEDRIDISTN